MLAVIPDTQVGATYAITQATLRAMDKSVSIVSLDLVYHTVRGQTPLPAHLYYDIIICVYTSERALSIVAERDYFAIDLKSFYASVKCQKLRGEI